MIATTALAVYEYLITLGDEVAVFWERKVNATSILFLLNRWTLVIQLVYQQLEGAIPITWKVWC